ncbi:MAG: GGDEF domain-containing protein [Nitrospiraceae bacterium]|nr:MAG: GGDEF domain-containing protein [Nitrospiraceae bacterium]
MNTSKKEADNIFMKRLREEIIPVLIKALSGGEGAVFENSCIASCWKTLACKSVECPLYGLDSGTVRCWQSEDTYCGGEHQGPFEEKYAMCSACRVFKDSCPSIVEETGELFNNIMFLFNKQKVKTLEDRSHIEHLSRELVAALEQIDVKNREIQKMMITDKLTGLFNRHHLITVLENEIARCNRYGHPLALMMIDIDGFKSINDAYGQSAGDIMLGYVGVLIKENTRKFDRSFRYGGEEFIVVLPETDMTLAYIVAERIRKGFEARNFAASIKGKGYLGNISRTLSIGITATFPYKTNNISMEDLLNQSDKALYLAKSKGGNISVKYE